MIIQFNELKRNIGIVLFLFLVYDFCYPDVLRSVEDTSFWCDGWIALEQIGPLKEEIQLHYEYNLKNNILISHFAFRTRRLYCT